MHNIKDIIELFCMDSIYVERWWIRSTDMVHTMCISKPIYCTSSLFFKNVYVCRKKKKKNKNTLINNHLILNDGNVRLPQPSMVHTPIPLQVPMTKEPEP